MKKNLFILGASSDIGSFLVNSYSNEYEIFGTYRSKKNLPSFNHNKNNIKFLKCDLNKKKDIDNLTKKLFKKKYKWDLAIFSVGDLSPIGNFEDLSFDEFSKSLQINFLGPLKILNKILKLRNKKGLKRVIFFSGSGTNNIQKKYSSYTISKIALIKATEQLNEEIKDVSFTILGPGWVNTKIHKSTVRYKKEVPTNYRKYLKVSKKNNTNEMMQIKNFLNWIIKSNKIVVGGRNFSIKNDPINNKSLIQILKTNNNYFKLRRFGNNLKI